MAKKASVSEYLNFWMGGSLGVCGPGSSPHISTSSHWKVLKSSLASRTNTYALLSDITIGRILLVLVLKTQNTNSNNIEITSWLNILTLGLFLMTLFYSPLLFCCSIKFTHCAITYIVYVSHLTQKKCHIDPNIYVSLSIILFRWRKYFKFNLKKDKIWCFHTSMRHNKAFMLSWDWDTRLN